MGSLVEERTINLNLVSASDLKKVKMFGEQKCYVVAYIYGNKQKATRVDTSGGLNPTWNAPLTLTCDEQLLQGNGRPCYITVQIYSDGTLQKKLVGTVTIPLREIDRDGSKAQIRAFSVIRPSGKVKGSLIMSAQLGELRTVQQQQHYGSQYPPVAFPQATASYQAPFSAPRFQPQYGGGLGGYGYGYPPMQQTPYGYGPPMGSGYQQRPRRGGAGFGTGLMGGALGGLLVGEMLDNDYGGDTGDWGGDMGGGDF